MKGNKDKEYIELRNRFLVGLFIAFVFGAGLIMFFSNRLSIGGKGISSKIKQKETFVIYVESNKCDNCKDIKEILDDNSIEYESLDADTQEAKNFFEKYKVVDDGHIVPAVIYVKKGKVYSSMYGITNLEEFNLFLKNYKLSK